MTKRNKPPLSLSKLAKFMVCQPMASLEPRPSAIDLMWATRSSGVAAKYASPSSDESDSAEEISNGPSWVTSGSLPGCWGLAGRRDRATLPRGATADAPPRALATRCADVGPAGHAGAGGGPAGGPGRGPLRPGAAVGRPGPADGTAPGGLGRAAEGAADGATAPRAATCGATAAAGALVGQRAGGGGGGRCVSCWRSRRGRAATGAAGACSHQAAGCGGWCGTPQGGAHFMTSRRVSCWRSRRGRAASGAAGACSQQAAGCGG